MPIHVDDKGLWHLLLHYFECDIAALRFKIYSNKEVNTYLTSVIFFIFLLKNTAHQMVL